MIKKSSHIGIGHTRWATHGVPNEINSHPHNSQNGKISVVHNGIIENYLELKNMLIEKGYTFKSETDTEVVAQLFEDLYDGDMVSTTRKLLEKIRGAYALGIMCTDHPGYIGCSQKGLPSADWSGQRRKLYRIRYSRPAGIHQRLLFIGNK